MGKRKKYRWNHESWWTQATAFEARVFKIRMNRVLAREKLMLHWLADVEGVSKKCLEEERVFAIKHFTKIVIAKTHRKYQQIADTLLEPILRNIG